MRVAALDMSLTSTGVAVRDDDGKVWTDTFGATGKRSDTLKMRGARLRRLRNQLLEVVGFPDLVMVEQPAYGQVGGSTHDRSGLWWQVVGHLLDGDTSLVEVSPPTLKKYILGSGKGDKDQILSTMIRRYPDILITKNDEADALGLLSMGCRLIGIPIESSLPAANLSALNKISLP